MPELRFNQNLRLAQTQKLALTQRIRQALEILQVPSMDLENLIRQELQDNPLLEQKGSEVKGESEKSSADETREIDDSWDEEPQRSDSREDDTLDILKRLDEHSGDSYTGSYRGDEDPWMPEPPSEPTLYEYLLDQVWSLMLPSDLEEAVIYVVYSLNRHGLLSLPDQELQSAWDGSPELLPEALKIVRALEPAGVGSLSASGALEIQLDKLGYDHDSLEYRIVSEHFNELAEKKIKAIAAAEKVSPRQVQEAIDRIAILKPWPGNEFSSSTNAAVIPDIIIIKVDDHFEAILNDNRFPHLMISARNRRILESPNTSPKEKEYVKKKFQKASWFIKAIRQRQETVTRIGEFLAEYQRDFFEHGIEGMRPLTLQMVADNLGFNQSTISRAINGKYVQSPGGIHDMRFFFSRALPGDGGDVSSRTAKDELRKLIESEDKNRPLSDAKLVQALEAAGIEVKRRTVANYRADMDIPSASKRKRY
ncbi:MAG: RNA polymerase factor sigma-54 [Candidatus Fermentibacteria bacterium]